MIFDTDILIWIARGNAKAAQLVQRTDERLISVQTYLELLQGARDKQELVAVKSFLQDFGFDTLPLTENIGHRAAIYMETYRLAHGLSAADALIAATATENNLVLASSNVKHFKPIKDLNLKAFHP